MAGTSADKLALLQATKDDLKAALTEKGQVPGDVFAEYPDMVRAIETGTQLPELTSPGAAADLRQGKQLIDQEGNVVDGTLVEVEQATPSISVSSAGLVTATAGDKSATKQLSSSDDADFVASNIKKDVSIFGIAGLINVARKMGFTEQLNDDAEGGLVSVTCDYDNGIITITPQLVLEQYSLDEINGVDNLTLQILESANSVYHRLALYFLPTDVYPRRCRFLYTWWTGKTAPDNANSTIELVLEGNISSGMKWDEENKVVTITADGDFLTALNTISNESTTDPSISGVITWEVYTY